MYHEVSRFYSYREGKEIVRWKGEYYHARDIIRRLCGYTCFASSVSLYSHIIAVNAGVQVEGSDFKK